MQLQEEELPEVDPQLEKLIQQKVNDLIVTSGLLIFLVAILMLLWDWEGCGIGVKNIFMMYVGYFAFIRAPCLVQIIMFYDKYWYQTNRIFYIYFSYEVIELGLAIYTLNVNSSKYNTCQNLSLYLYSPLWLFTYFCYYTVLKAIAVGIVILIILVSIFCQ